MYPAAPVTSTGVAVPPCEVLRIIDIEPHAPTAPARNAHVPVHWGITGALRTARRLGAVASGMHDVVLLGGGGHARVLHDVLLRLGHRVMGYAAPTPEDSRIALPYLGRDDEVLGRLEAADTIGALGIGMTRVDDHRLRLLATYEAARVAFPPLVAPGAIVHGDVDLGDASVVLDGAVVVTGSRLGRACIVNTNASVDHDCRLGENVHVAPGATICGGVSIGAHGLVGAGATLVHGVDVCAWVVIGAGATVIHDISEPGTYLGTPARRV